MYRKNSVPFLIVTLGLLSAFAPFVTDLYLPSLPSLSKYFDTTTALAQMSLSSSMFGLAAGQLLVGPLSDKYGRRLPLLVSIILFILATLACIFSWDIYSFIFFRLLQGAAGAGGIVLSKSISTDLYSGRELTKFMALIAAINAMAPIFAPVIGGVMLKFTDWIGVFVLLLFIGLILLFLSVRLNESLPKEQRTKGSILSTFKNFGPVFRNRTFVYFALQQSFALATMFVYISASPFIIQVHYGCSPLIFSLCFAVNALGVAIGSTLSMRFHQPLNSILVGNIGLVFFAIATAVCLLLDVTLLEFEFALFPLLTFMGLTLPASTALALDSSRGSVGTASATLGATTFLFAGICAPLVGIGSLMHTSAYLLLITAFSSMVFCFLALRIYKRSSLK